MNKILIEILSEIENDIALRFSFKEKKEMISDIKAELEKWGEGCFNEGRYAGEYNISASKEIKWSDHKHKFIGGEKK